MRAHDPTVAERESPLQHEIEDRTRDLDWTLAHFSFVANVTTLATECDIAHSPAMSVASCRSVPQMALAFVGDSADLLATYANFLADPGSEVDLLVNDEQRAVVEAAFDVSDVTEQWQLVFEGDVHALLTGDAVELADNDFNAIHDLAEAENFVVELLAENPLQYGPAFGVWERRRLLSMGMSIIEIPGAVQIGNVLTRTGFRGKGNASTVVAALVKHYVAQERAVFTVVNQKNKAALELFKKLGFVRARPMYVMHCVIRDQQPEGDV